MGAEYLKDEIKKNLSLSNYHVPDYIIVAEDPDNIKVTLKFYHFQKKLKLFPSIHTIDNATIYFKKIVGKAITIRDEDLEKIGFSDFNVGNILKTKNGKFYIIDTEAISFTLKPKDAEIEKLFRYALKKFNYLNNNIEFYTFNIDLYKI